MCEMFAYCTLFKIRKPPRAAQFLDAGRSLHTPELDHSPTLQGEDLILEPNGIYANIPLLASYSGALTKTNHVITVG